MRDYQIFIVDAFTNKSFGGNPAGIVLDAQGLTDEQMQAIAGELKQSETAFINQQDVDRFEVRFFTPVAEVDLCGHATIASFWTLGAEGHIETLENGRQEIIQATKAGLLKVYLDYEDHELIRVTMAQPEAEYLGTLKNVEKLAEALSIDVEDIGIDGYELPLEFVSTGIKDLMLPVQDRETLSKIKLKPEVLEELSREEEFYSVHAYTFDGTPSNIYQRNFCPILAIDEEAATGTSTGALISYLNRHKILDKPYLQATQGLEMDRPSKLEASIETINGNEELLVGGQAKILLSGVLSL